MVLALTKIGLNCFPDLPALLKTTLRTPSSPGAIGALGYCGTVQPQVEDALVMINGFDPVFLKRKLYCTTSPWLIVPKS